METQTHRTIVLNKGIIGKIVRLGTIKAISLNSAFTDFNDLELGDMVEITVNVVKKNLSGVQSGRGIKVKETENKNVVMELTSPNPLDVYWKSNFTGCFQ